MAIDFFLLIWEWTEEVNWRQTNVVSNVKVNQIYRQDISVNRFWVGNLQDRPTQYWQWFKELIA